MLQNFRGGAGSGYVRVVLNKSEDPGSNPVIRNSYIKHLFTINCIGHLNFKNVRNGPLKITSRPKNH